MTFPLATLSSPRALALSVVILAAGTGSVSAQSMNSPTQVMPDDREFITSMLQESRDQLALARLATRRASSAETSTAAAETTDEWSSLRARLMSIVACDSTTAAVRVLAWSQASPFGEGKVARVSMASTVLWHSYQECCRSTGRRWCPRRSGTGCR